MTPSHLAVMAGSLAASLLFAFILMAAGARLRRLLGFPLAADLKAPCDFLAGCWLFGMLALLGGLAGLFRGPFLLGLVAVLAASGRWRRSGWRWTGLLPPLLTCLLLLPVALARPFFYDALVYHLALPWQSLVEGRIAAHAEDLFSAFPPLAQLVFAAPVAAGLDRAAALLHLWSFVMAGAAIAALARRMQAPGGWARSAGALLPLLPVVVLVPGFPAAEGFVLGGVVTGLAVALFRIGREDAGGPGGDRAARRASSRRRVALTAAAASGFLLGAASAARLQGLFWTLILLLLLAAGPVERARRPLAAAAGWVAGSAPWWLKNLILLGHPLAPVGWRRPGIETLWRDSGGQIFLAPGAGDLALGLWRGVRPHLAYAGPLILAALFAVAAGGARRARRGAGTVLLAAVLGTAAWCLTGSLPRFWAPSLALLLALAAAAAATTAGRWAGSLAIATTAVLGLTSTTREIGNLGGARLLLPGDGASASLIVNNPLPAFETAADLPSGVLPRDALVLFVSEARGYRFPRRCLVPSQHDVSPLSDLVEASNDAAAVQDALGARGITHLLVNRAEMARLAARYPVLPWKTPLGQERFQRLLDLCGAPIVKEGETALFALEGARAAQFVPVWPKPPGPRRVAESPGASTRLTPATGAITSWAIRSPRRMVTACCPRLTATTAISPR